MNNFLRCILKMSKHPLIVLIAGAVIGSIVIPRINSRMDQERRQQEMRANRGTAVVEAGWDTERRFNLVETTFESFYKDQLIARTATDNSRRVLRNRVDETYQAFDRDAWWWHGQALEEIKALRLLDDVRLRELDTARDNYQKALVDSVAELDHYQEDLLRGPQLVTPEKGELTFNRVKPRLEQLGEQRRKSIRQMVQTIVY